MWVLQRICFNHTRGLEVFEIHFQIPSNFRENVELGPLLPLIRIANRFAEKSLSGHYIAKWLTSGVKTIL